MVQLSTVALFTAAQVALYSTSALAGPIDITGTELEARAGTGARIALGFGKDKAKEKAVDLATQYKDQKLNQRPNLPTIAQQAAGKQNKGGAGGSSAPKAVKASAPVAGQRRPSIAEQAKNAADASKKHPVQAALRKQRRALDELYDLDARDLDFDLLEARAGTGARIALGFGKDKAKEKAVDLATQYKDQKLNQRPNLPTIAQQAADRQHKGGAGGSSAPKAVKAPAPVAGQRRPSIAEQAKNAADASKKHPVQAALRKQRRALDDLYDLDARDFDFDLLEARAGTGARIALGFGKDKAKEKAVDLATQYKDQTLNKRPNLPTIAQQAADKQNKGGAGGSSAPKAVKAPAPAGQRRPSIAEQAKHASDTAKKHPVQAALRKQRRALEYDLEERDLDGLYDLAARDLGFDFLEARQMLKKRPNTPTIGQKVMEKQKNEQARVHPAPLKAVKAPAFSMVQKKPSIVEQVKQAADAAKRHPVQAALRRQRRAFEYDLEERDLDELYDLAARDLDFDLEARESTIWKKPAYIRPRPQRRALESELTERDLESLYDLVTRDLYSDMLEERSLGAIDDLD